MMEDLVTTFTNDWDLEAIIRGWGGGGSAYSMADVMEASPPPPASYSGSDPSPLGLEFGGFDADELEATATVLNELELLYKPFLLQHHPPICTDSPTKTEASSPSQADFYGCIDRDDDVDTHELKKPSVADKNPREKASCKRRKSRQKLKVIYRGGGGDDDENLAEMDQWNWRKYGQKSIKGSPYPRSYYRCSSGGGCQARKQVEQSKDEPDAYVVTYMGEHTHPVPTRRRSLAGRKLTKFSSSGTASVDSTGL